MAERKRFGDVEVITLSPAEAMELLTSCWGCGAPLADDNPICVCPECQAKAKALEQRERDEDRRARADHDLMMRLAALTPIKRFDN